MEDYHKPVRIHKRVDLDNKIYYYLEFLPSKKDKLGNPDRSWIRPFRDGLGGSELEYNRWLTPGLSLSVCFSFGAALAVFMKEVKVMVDGDEVRLAEIIQKRMKPDIVKPLVHCYCEPSVKRCQMKTKTVLEKGIMSSFA